MNIYDDPNYIQGSANTEITKVRKGFYTNPFEQKIDVIEIVYGRAGTGVTTSAVFTPEAARDLISKLQAALNKA